MAHTDVTVAVTTFNHANYLREALDSVLSQKTDYSYELFVLDDCSTDGTRDILIQYARRHPDRVRPILHDTNRGSLASFIELFEQLPGTYIALLDGDDYWRDPSKLQTQVRFLERNPDFVLCGHACVVRNEWTGAETLVSAGREDLTLTTRELIDFHIPSSSMVFRNGLIRGWPESLLRAGWEDRPLVLMLSERGKVRYLSAPMSTYRMHSGGVWCGQYVINHASAIPETSREGWLKLMTFWAGVGEYFGHCHDDRISELMAQARAQIERLS